MSDTPNSPRGVAAYGADADLIEAVRNQHGDAIADSLEAHLTARVANAQALDEIQQMLDTLPDRAARQRVLRGAMADNDQRIAQIEDRNDQLRDQLVELADEHLPGWDDEPDEAA